MTKPHIQTITPTLTPTCAELIDQAADKTDFLFEDRLLGDILLEVEEGDRQTRTQEQQRTCRDCLETRQPTNGTTARQTERERSRTNSR